MFDLENPYQSPATNVEVIKPLASQGYLTEIMIKHLVGASPWLRFLGIMGFIGSGFFFLGGLLAFAFLPFVDFNNMDVDIPYFSFFLRSVGPLIILYALYFFGTGVLILLPALFTYRFGEKISAYTRSNSEQDLEMALKNNKSLWKFNGIMMIIGLSALPIIIVIMIIAAVVMAIL